MNNSLIKKFSFYTILMLSFCLHVDRMNAQLFNFSVTPQAQCFNPVPFTNTAISAVTATNAAATSYTWSFAAPTATCPPQFTVVPSSLPSGTQAVWLFNCCGVYSIYCQPFNGSTPIQQPLLVEHTVVCASQAAIITPTAVCLGSQITMTAGGAVNFTSYAWTGPSGPISTTSLAIVTPTANTCYTLTGNSAQGCSVGTSTCITVSGATISAAPASQSMCAGNNVCFTANVGAVNNSSYAPGTATTQVQWFGPGGPIGPPGYTACTNAPASSSIYTAQVTYTGAAGTCTAEATSSVIITTSIPVTITPVSPTICPGQAINLTASSIQTAALSYTWTKSTPGLPTSTVGNPISVAPTVATQYYVDVLYGTCPGSATVSVSMASLNPVLNISPSLSICPSTTLNLSASGGITYTFVATPAVGGSFVVPSSFNAGVHAPSAAQLPIQYCVRSASSGCTGTTCLTVVERTLFPVLGAVNPSICPGSNASFSISSGAGTSYTVWSVNTQASIGSTVAPNVLTTALPSNVLPQTFSVTADSAGCVGSSTFFNIDSLRLNPVIVPSSPSVCPGTNFTLTAANRGAGSTFTWTIPPQIVSNPNTTVSTGGTNSITQASTLFPITYYVLADSIGCIGSGAVTVHSLQLGQTLTLSPTSPSICPGTAITVTAKGAQTYTFYMGTGVIIPSTNGVATFTPPGLGHTITVLADSSTCSGSKTLAIAQKYLSPTFSIAAGASQTVCAGMPTTLAVGGVGYGSMTSFTVLQTQPPPIGSVAVSSNSLIQVNPTVQTLYTLLADSAGCIGQFPFPTLSVYMYPALSLTAAATSPSICSGTSVALSVAGPTNALYTWYEPNGSGSVSIGTTTTVVRNPTISTTYTVNAIDPLGCVGQATIDVGIDPLAQLSLTLTGTTGTICPTLFQSDTMYVSGAQSYSWSPPAGLSTLTGFSTTASPNITTIYTVTGTNNAGCFGFATYTVSIGSVPVLTIVPTASVICPGYTSTLTAFGANTYTWVGSGSYSVPVLQQSISVTPGVFSVTGSNGGGCISSTLISITSGSQLAIHVTQSTPTTCIESNNPKFSKAVVLTASGAGSYVWFPYNPCCMTYSLGPSTTVRPPATTQYTVTGFTSVCSGTAVVQVTVIPQFTMNVVPPTPAMCVGDSLKMRITNVGTLAVGPASKFSYSWTENANAPRISIDSELSQSVTIWPKNTTTYTVEMFDSRGCASLPRLVTVSVFPRPVTAIAIPTINNVPTNTVCFVGQFPGPTDNVITLTAVNKNTGLPFGIIPTYTWNSPNNSILTPIYNTFIVANAPNRTPGVVVYTVASGYNGIPGCRRIDTVSVRVVDCRPVYKVSFSTAEKQDTICARSCITFVNNTDTMAGGPQKLFWTFDGGTPRTSTLQIPTICYNLPGEWSVILRVENPFPREKPDGSLPGSSLTSGQLKLIKVTDIPNVTIVSPGQLRSDTTIRFGQSVTLKGSGATSYAWSPAYNISALTGSVVTVRPFRSTQYILTGYNSSECASADTMNVIVIDDCGEMFVPTAFSPNNDGHNDVLKVNGICLQTMTFMIFNRWGEKVFETTDQNIGWDGTFNGSILNTGVYVYRLEGKTYDGKGFSAKGNITLIR